VARHIRQPADQPDRPADDRRVAPPSRRDRARQPGRRRRVRQRRSGLLPRPLRHPRRHLAVRRAAAPHQPVPALDEPPYPTDQVSGRHDQRDPGQGARRRQRVRPRHRHRFASREKAILGQFEVGIAAIPGGGPSTRLPGIVGRGRGFEILLGGDDFDGDLAERYGYVNRAIPDADFVRFVDAFAERVSRFDLLALADIKRFVNDSSLPADAPLTAEMDAFTEAVARPASQSIVAKAVEQGLAQRSDLELNFGAYIGNSIPDPSTLPTR
jgi:hypothetical protein